MWTADLRGSGESSPDDTWVTGTPTGAQRVPGIDEAPEAKYVDPTLPSPWRPVLIGVGIGLAVTAIVGAIVFGSRTSDEQTVTPGPATAITRAPDTGDRSSATTTTTVAAAPPPSTAAAATPVAPVAPVAPAPTAAPAPPAPTPRATANPALPPYADQPLPAGVTASIGTCAWQTANGGQLLASGTVTNAPTTNKPWTLTMHFLQNRRELAQSSVVVPLGAGQSKPWTISTRLTNPPPDLICSLSAS
jgi:hypothetical protein